MHYPLGILDEPRDGIRPLLASPLNPLVFALFDPRDHSQPLLETPGPVDDSGNASRIACGDFDGNGAREVAVFLSKQGAPLAILDQHTLEAQTTRSFPSELFSPAVAAIDVDGDGVTDLVTAAQDDEDRTIRAWALRQGTLSEIGSAVLPMERSPSLTRGDFDGDSNLDLAVVLSPDSESLWLLRGASLDDATLPLDEIPQPSSTWRSAAADVDGDGDDELVMLHTAKDLTFMDWTEDGLVQSAPFTVDVDAEERSTPQLYVGKDEGRPDWLIVGQFESSDEVVQVAVFPNRAEATPIALGRDIGYGTGLVADYDDDGLSDFMVRDGEQHVVYMSIE